MLHCCKYEKNETSRRRETEDMDEKRRVGGLRLSVV